ncbi:MAG: chromosome segregation protein SMC [Phycisphaerae bacterium]
MKLKKLIVSGFKSFADKTEFDFDDGISCVVGPNGCGKSNVVDAVKWVLGEQSAKSLRGKEMMDIIFNGSSTRRASGSASVTLVFDNEDGLLQPPLGGDDQQKDDHLVSITRRLYRSGVSEYLINKTQARLKDIREMFMDTGLGRDAYGVIEQGKVEAFLQASQDDRRAIFDEAAGISKYKARKKEALRKLERVEQNLLRVTDVLAEVEKRLRSIKYQAGKARNYQTYTQQLKELRSLDFLARYHKLIGRRHEAEQKLDTATDKLSGVNARIGQLESSRSATEVEAVDLERTARDLQARIAAVSGQITACEQRSEMLTNRAGELGDQIVQTSSQCEELEAKIDTANQDLQQRKAQLEQVKTESESLAGQLAAERETHTAGDLAIADKQAELEEQKSIAIDLMRQVARFNNEIAALGVRQENLTAQKQRLEVRAGQIEADLAETRTARQAAAAEAETITHLIAETQKQLDLARSKSQQLADDEQKLSASLAEAREDRSGILSRTRALEEMQNRLEGVAGGVKRVIKAKKQGQLEIIEGMFGSYIDADVEHARIVEAALAGADQLLVVRQYSQLAEARDELAKVLGDSGVEILCVDRVRSTDNPVQPAAEVVGCVADFVRCEDWINPAATSVLGRTYLVEDLPAAIAAADTMPGCRFVTRAGEVVEADGRLRLGAAARGSGIIARRSELAELETRRKQLDQTIDTLQQQCSDTRSERKEIEQTSSALREKLHEANTRRVQCASKLAQLDEQIEKLLREQPTVTNDLAAIDQDIRTAAENESATRGKISQAETQAETAEKAAEQIEASIAAARQAQQAQAERITELKVQLASVEQRTLSIRDTVSSLGRQIEEMGSDLSQGRSFIELSRQRKADAETGAKAAMQEIEALYAQQQTLSRDFDEAEESRKSLAEKLDEIRKQLTERRRDSETSTETVNALKVQLNDAEVRIENIISRAADEMNMDLADLYENYEHDEDRDWQAVQEEIEDLRGKIDRLGNVNLDAISEQEELEKRQEFLTEQIGDIRNSQQQLSELIKRINTESRQLFLDTFDSVRKNFRELFRKLFGGGKADIMLLDPEDVLESGIEIVARPPGKELRNLSLLSGGEKTMTALSLLFSIFKSRPSPFCLLDEVDAALDEANTERFSLLLQEFVELSQFIVISHAKRTMAMSNVLYGVTMQEPGVSTRISVRFEDVRDEEVDQALAPVGA